MPEFNFKSPVVTRKVSETEIILKENDETKKICSDGRVILDKSINYGKQ